MGALLRRLRQLSVGPRPVGGSTRVLRSGEALRCGEPGWRQRLTHPTDDGRPDLRDVDFRACSLAGVDLSGCRLDRSVFDGTSLGRTVFTTSDLSGASFVGSSLEEARFEAVRAHDVRFDRARLRGASFVAANLAFTSFRHAALDGADLRSATFLKADLRNAVVSASLRTGTDFEEADTTCVVGGDPRPSEWGELANAHHARSFASALRQWRSFMRLTGPAAELGLRAIEAAIEAASDHQQALRGLLAPQRDWRVALIGAVGMLSGGADQQTVELGWTHLERGSWVSPQLVVAAARADPGFVERASRVLAEARVQAKTRGALAAALLTWFPERLDPTVARLASDLSSSEREGFLIAVRWAQRFDELTAPI